MSVEGATRMEMDIKNHYYYKLSIILMSIYGISPFETGRWCYVRRYSVVFASSIPAIAQTVLLITEENVIELSFRILPFLVVNITIVSLAIYVSIYQCQIKRIYDLISDDWKSPFNEAELAIKRRYAKFAIIFGKFILVLFSVGMPVFIVLSAFSSPILDFVLPLNESRPLKLPFEGNYLLDEQEHFYVIVFSLEIILTMQVYYGITIQLGLLIFIQHAYGMFEVTGNRLSHVGVNNNNDSNYYEALIFCMECHQKAVEFTDIVATFMGPGFGILLMTILITLAISLLQLSETELFDYRVPMQILLSCVVLFLNNFFGQKLINHSRSTSYKIYFSDWYKYPVQIQKLLPLMILRCGRECSITSFGLATASYDCFRTVMQTSVSYFTVLKQVR